MLGSTSGGQKPKAHKTSEQVRCVNRDLLSFSIITGFDAFFVTRLDRISASQLREVPVNIQFLYYLYINGMHRELLIRL